MLDSVLPSPFVLAAQISVAYPVGVLPFSILVPPTLAPILPLQAPVSGGHRQTQASMAPPWSPEGDSSGTGGQFSPSPKLHWRDWAPKATSTSTATLWQHDQWPVQWPYWSAWGVLVTVMPPSHGSSATTLKQQLPAPTAPDLEHEACSEVEAEETAHTLKPPSLTGEDAPGLPWWYSRRLHPRARQLPDPPGPTRWAILKNTRPCFDGWLRTWA